MSETLTWRPARDHPDLLAPPVTTALATWERGGDVAIAPIDPGDADTAAFCARYGVAPEESANCVVVLTRRGDVTRYVACVVLATTRADVNGLVRRRVDARKASFAPMVDAVTRSGMDYGGITPVGLPADWTLLVDARVPATSYVVVGSGIRGSKLRLPGASLAELPGAEVVEGLAAPVT